MKNTIENYKGQQFEFETYFSHSFKGKGGWNVDCEVTYKNKKKTFVSFTTNSEFIDSIKELKTDNASWEAIQNVYAERFLSDMEERILEFVEDVEEELLANQD
jgi:hypothetical protein